MFALSNKIPYFYTTISYEMGGEEENIWTMYILVSKYF